MPIRPVTPGCLVVRSLPAVNGDLGMILGVLGESGNLIMARCSPGDAASPESALLRDTDLEWSDPFIADLPVLVRHQDTATVAESDVIVAGQVTRDALARVLRGRIAGNTRWFHDAFHARQADQPVNAVPYSGRVFDHRELQLAVEASLDFWLTLGRHGERLQRDLAAYLGVRRTIMVNSGSSANLLALSALTSPRLGDRALTPGSEVITTAGGFPTTLNPILQSGCTAVLVDNDAHTGNVDITRLEDAASERTRAVILAHTLGNPFNLREVQRFCAERDLWLIEDTCDALGSTYEGRLVGSFGDLSTLSFYPAHHMTTGEGGAVNVVHDIALARIVGSFRDWGHDCWCESGQDNVCGSRFSGQYGTLPPGYDHKYVYSHVGYNLKPTDWQAAIGCAQLAKLTEFTAARRRNWKLLWSVFEPFQELFELPYAEPRSDPSWFAFKLSVREGVPFGRNDVVSFFEANRIQTRMLFGGNLARQPAYRDHRHADGSPAIRVAGPVPGADQLMRNAFFIGVYPGLDDTHIEYVSNVLQAFADSIAHRPASFTELVGSQDLRRAARDSSSRRAATRALRNHVSEA